MKLNCNNLYIRTVDLVYSYIACTILHTTQTVSHLIAGFVEISGKFLIVKYMLYVLAN